MVHVIQFQIIILPKKITSTQTQLCYWKFYLLYIMHWCLTTLSAMQLPASLCILQDTFSDGELIVLIVQSLVTV